MQKILRLLIILFLFIVCLFIGANLANVTLPENNNRTNLVEADETQTQFLIFVIDNFENRKPQLQSIWSVIFYYQDSYGIMFIPLTDKTKLNFDELEKSFILTPERELNERTIKFFNTKYKTKWNSAIVLDQIAVTHLLKWASNNQINETPDSLTLTTGHIDTLCLSLSNNIPSVEGVEWPLLIPDRFKSNLSIEQMKNIWNNFEDSSSLLCEIIEN